ncbi:uncharacterized protein A4U43_C06F11240 [Asparagus officinalis]|uniref:Uncharacterized protein n=1 Tax=Asparagus officinalis TaxID=4686 RepID=A0A5P1EL42_ASPOF|nr:uncharacterized protein A4U43_C06F11240 [Asparagus officinalis]
MRVGSGAGRERRRSDCEGKKAASLMVDWLVLFLVSPMDEPGLSNLNSYKEKKFINITKEDLDLGDTNTKKEREFKLELGSTCDWIKKTLGDKVASVKNFQLPYYFALCASHWEVWFVNQHGKVDEETQT